MFPVLRGRAAVTLSAGLLAAYHCSSLSRGEIAISVDPHGAILGEFARDRVEHDVYDLSPELFGHPALLQHFLVMLAVFITPPIVVSIRSLSRSDAEFLANALQRAPVAL